LLSEVSGKRVGVVEVYFDDFKVTHTKSPVIQADDYYPFGLAFNSYQRENSTPNLYQYNGKELQDELNLGWYDYLARQYDPVLGRFLSIDPAASAMRRYSPYTYAFDNPLRFTDPDGMVPEESTGGPGDDDKKKKEEEQKKKQEAENKEKFQQLLKTILDDKKSKGKSFTVKFKSDATSEERLAAVGNAWKSSRDLRSSLSTANDMVEVGGALSGKFKTPGIIGNTLFGLQVADHLANDEYGGALMETTKFIAGKVIPLETLLAQGFDMAAVGGLPDAARSAFENSKKYEVLAIRAYNAGDYEEANRLTQIAKNEKNAAIQSYQHAINSKK